MKRVFCGLDIIVDEASFFLFHCVQGQNFEEIFLSRYLRLFDAILECFSITKRIMKIGQN